MRLIYYTGIGGQTTIQGSLGMAGEPENYSNYNSWRHRDLVPLIGNYNFLRPVSWPFVGMPKITPTTSPSPNWMEHSFKPHYQDLVSQLKPNGPCVPLLK
jgi:hypothetical protein